MKRRLTYLLVLGCTVLLLVGCGGNEPIREGGADVFATVGDKSEHQGLWALEYVEWTKPDMELEEGEEFFLMSPMVTNDDAGRSYQLRPVIANENFSKPLYWILECFDRNTREITYKKVQYEDLGLTESDAGQIFGMDWTKENGFAIWWIAREQKDNALCASQCSLILTDFSGKMETVDLLSGYLRTGIVQETENYAGVGGNVSVAVDKDGYSYVLYELLTAGYGKVSVFDRRGKELLTYDIPKEQLLETGFRDANGELIFCVFIPKEKTHILYSIDKEKGQLVKIATLPEEKKIYSFAVKNENVLYYETDDGIVEWNVEEGSRNSIFVYENGAASLGMLRKILSDDGELPMIQITVKDGVWFLRLGTEENKLDKEIRIVNVVGTGDVAKSTCASELSRRYLGQMYTYQEISGQEQVTRLYTEMMQGEGPDILCVDGAELQNLKEKGLLMELDDLLEEIKQDCVPAAWSLGVIDEKLYGVPQSVATESLAVTEESFEGQSWTLEQLIELMDKGQLEKGVFFGQGESKTYFAPLAEVLILTTRCMEDSFLIDWEKRESHFEDERFIRLLEATSQMLSVNENGADRIGRGIRMIGINDPQGLEAFGAWCEQEKVNMIGYPCEEGNGSYISADSFLVVNAKTAEPEMAKTYIETLLEDGASDFGLRKLSLEDIITDEAGDSYWQHGPYHIKLTVFSDGTTSLHRAKEFIESCRPTPQTYSVIEDILREELGAFYEGDKSAAMVAEIIDNRVQMYLSE